MGSRVLAVEPGNLPRLQPFFGREQELAAIRDALDPEARTWGALIDGPGGMGKTSLAVRAAYDCPPGQFQRILSAIAEERSSYLSRRHSRYENAPSSSPRAPPW